MKPTEEQTDCVLAIQQFPAFSSCLLAFVNFTVKSSKSKCEMCFISFPKMWGYRQQQPLSTRTLGFLLRAAGSSSVQADWRLMYSILHGAALVAALTLRVHGSGMIPLPRCPAFSSLPPPPPSSHCALLYLRAMDIGYSLTFCWNFNNI